MMGISGDVKASISVVPQRSQIFVTISALAAIACLGVGFVFMWYDKPKWEFPFWIAGIAGLVAFVSWGISHRNVDLSEGQATKITMSAQEMSVVLDPRTAVPPNLMQQFAGFLSAVAQRAPLPPSSGMVDNHGQVIKGSEEEASRGISDANLQAKLQTEEVVRLFGELPSPTEVNKGVEVPTTGFTAKG